MDYYGLSLKFLILTIVNTHLIIVNLENMRFTVIIITTIELIVDRTVMKKHFIIITIIITIIIVEKFVINSMKFLVFSSVIKIIIAGYKNFNLYLD